MVYPDYIIKQKGWEIWNTTFDPSTYTLNAINTILELYGKPNNPSSSKWTYIPVNYKGIPKSVSKNYAAV